MPSQAESRLIESQRVAHLATADAKGRPHVVPVCFAYLGGRIYIAIDEKPKRSLRLKRLRNIEENPHAALVLDRYDEDWTQLGWVMLQGRAEVLSEGREHDEAQALLCSRYPQLQAMRIAACPVIAVRIERARSWGHLSV